jgi:tRNA nucleotidyltransferase (CCA-adding enzyme)
MDVSERFNALLNQFKLTPAQQEDGRTKHAGVRSTLNAHYYGTSSQYANSLLVGSWGKSTAIRPPRDVDVMFVLPFSVYERFQKVTGNKQSQLLQEVKGVLQRTYTSTTMRADGQIIIVPFASYAVEVVPAFLLQSGQYYICDTNGGGSYKTVDPVAEEKAVTALDTKTNGNARNLIRMMKRSH